MKVSNYLSGAVRQFSYWFVHGTLGYPILEGIDYLNYQYCERRAAEYIRGYFEPDYSLDKPFEDWELELHPVSREAYNQ